MDGLLVASVAIVGGLLVVRAVRARRQTRSSVLQLGTIPRSLRLFEFRNVIVPDERGTTEIDVIFVGNAGVFVIERKDYNAWIFGSEDDEKWPARYLDGSTYQLQNPLRQNYRHVMALVAQLGIPRDNFHSLVAFSGNCELKTPMPPNVLIGDYVNRVRRTDGIRLTDADVSRICAALRALESRSTREALDEHVGRLHQRFASTTTCPKCGAPLVERRSTKPTSDGEPFLGCRAFPRCTYIRKLTAT
jgi:restriction system protein